MRLLFEGGIYFVQELRIVQLLFEGGRYSRMASIRRNMVVTVACLCCAWGEEDRTGSVYHRFLILDLLLAVSSPNFIDSYPKLQ